MALRLSSILVSTFAAQTVAGGHQKQEFWAHAELAEGELQGDECDVSLLQSSLHTSLDTSQIHSQAHSRASRKDPPRKELQSVPEPVSLFQKDIELKVSSKDTVTIESGPTNNAGLSLVSEPDKVQAPVYFTQEQLALTTWALKLLAVFIITSRGALSFIRFLTAAKSKDPPCEQSTAIEIKPEPVKRRKNKEAGIFEHITELPLASSEEIDTLLLSRGAGYDCNLPKPRKMGKARRFRARIHGPANGSDSLVGPVTQEACVLYHATARRRLAEKVETAEGSVVGTCRGSVDFVANLENFPDIKFTVRGEEVEMFSMHAGSSKKCSTLREASGMRLSMVSVQEGAALEDEEFEFEESALRIGEVVTLVGDLHCDTLGALSLWPAPRSSRSAHGGPDESFTAAFDDLHVFASDCPQLGASAENSPV